jgi:hypothetical protein
MFDPIRDREACERYLSRSLGGHVELVGAGELTKGTRQAPWKLDVTLDGTARAYVLQLDPRGLEYECRVLQAMEAIGFPRRAPTVSTQGEALGFLRFSDFIAGESMLGPMMNSEPAEAVYVDTISAALRPDRTSATWKWTRSRPRTSSTPRGATSRSTLIRWRRRCIDV